MIPYIQQRIKESRLQEKLEKWGAEIDAIVFLMCDVLSLPCKPYRDMVYPSGPKEVKKIKNKVYKKMERNIKNHVEKDKWKEILKLRTDLRNAKYVYTVYGPEPLILSKYPKLRLIWMLKTYFEILTKEKEGKGRPCWDSIAELLSIMGNTTCDEATLSSWWSRGKKNIVGWDEDKNEEVWDGECFLDSTLTYYRMNKAVLDKQCEEFFNEYSLQERDRIRI